MISQWVTRAKQFYYEIGDNDTRPRFISNTDSPYNDILHCGSLNSKSYCFDILSDNWASQYYIVRFKGPEGVAISRRDFCKAWALSRRTVAFLGGLQSSIQDWGVEQEHAEDLETISELLRKYEAYWDELSFVMQHISSWERIGYLPFVHAPLPPDYKSLVINPGKPRSRRWILKGVDDYNWVPLEAYFRCESPFSALYIFYVKKILELHEEGFEDRWFAMWDKWGPDPAEYGLYRFPGDVPISESELQLRKKSQGVDFGELLSDFGDISRTPVRGYDE
ncbi:hypothetical protein L198_07156 [Cryptococcus wingfieldii CBS 7118]|uniref:Uncharacterized protein n=1 Tax=Cryptococcus wingfieldii CBS 7118 TaxID=1295528 RepID=A0A1E3IDU4_9TREE|nr:hypothetical protein L198_07156 [Cryptococcus wingfieldii CBS 7118]ODN86794.1 hypothetical protein L198_07156 [Cryptococcus wingfieldii CBS 7118]